MRVHDGFVCRSVAITDRGRAEKNAQRIACQLLEGRAREVPICCKLLSTKGGSGTEGCGSICRSRIAWLFRLCTEYLKSARRHIWHLSPSASMLSQIYRDAARIGKPIFQRKQKNRSVALCKYITTLNLIFSLRFTRASRRILFVRLISFFGTIIMSCENRN